MMNTSLKRAASFRPSLLQIFFAAIPLLLIAGNVFAQEKIQVIHLAKLKIDSAQLENYKAALREEIETSIRVEPGVLTLYAIAEKNNPGYITIFEVYADTDAYRAHLASPHFKKYKSVTKDMVRSLQLIDAVPLALASKAKL
jgi:quinol monooxygenase YgiN